ncbi:prostasin-like isoform X2 [Denticeps clupeoides]|uniref:prostasin-like isoform X2 n=1 Tax=Denticeps clupeoides TaxID=299321 RepID=UPI0010A4206C|nr:prostasin-like isoform X2 [Denticeps clupeoides]
MIVVLVFSLLSLLRDVAAEQNGTLEDRLGNEGVRSFPSSQDMEDRILGGREAWPHSWPWQVSLQFGTMQACGGAVLSPLWVVTAAHCFKKYNAASLWTVMAGKHDLDNPHETFQQAVKVERIIPHQNYSSQTKENDLALVKLGVALIMNECVRPIQILGSPVTPLMTCTVTGWGSTRENGPQASRLQEVNVTVLQPETCSMLYRGMRQNMLCAGRLLGGVDACQGDSGGPLSCFDGDRYELAGVVSWGVGCGRQLKPGVYTNLHGYTDWITQTVEDHTIVSAAKELCDNAEAEPCGLDRGPAHVADGARVANVGAACPHSWPWQVSLQNEDGHYCSGVLVHPRWVLAARHCHCEPSSDVAVLGLHNLTSHDAQTIRVEGVFGPPEGSDFVSCDLSLIRLSEEARLGPTVAQVCVQDGDVPVNDSWTCVMTGWGLAKATSALNPDVLHQARLEVVDVGTCRTVWGEDTILDTHLCTDAAGSPSCMGDPGAPLLCRHQGPFQLVGVSAWGSKRCGGRKPAVFTRVSACQSWVRRPA